MTGQRFKEFRTRLFGLILLSCIIIVLRGFYSHHTRQTHAFFGQTMGTSYSITLVRTPLNNQGRRDLEEKISALLDAQNAIFSTYIDTSEVSNFNRSAQVNEAIALSLDLFQVMSMAVSVYHQSGGYFDITVAPLLDAWGFGREEATASTPPENLPDLLAHLGSDKLNLDRSKQTLSRSDQRVIINLNAIAKGHVVDRIGALLETTGSRDYLVEIGGEILCRGRNSQGKPWRIGIDAPVDSSLPGEALKTVVALGDQAMATSGDYRQFRMVNGKRLSHTMNPRTGRPVSHNLASVTVIASHCMLADAYATALHVMGFETGIEWVRNRKGVEALFILRTPDHTFRMEKTSGFPEPVSTGA